MKNVTLLTHISDDGSINPSVAQFHMHLTITGLTPNTAVAIAGATAVLLNGIITPVIRQTINLVADANGNIDSDLNWASALLQSKLSQMTGAAWQDNGNKWSTSGFDETGNGISITITAAG